MKNNKKHKGKKKTIGFTCSAFDLCHAGHMLLLKEAKDNCDHLIVGLQDDPSVDNHINMQYRGKLKPPPVMSVQERKIILESIKYIDEIFVYRDEEDLYKNIQRLHREGKYHRRFIGEDYRGRHYTGDDIPHEIYFINRDHGFSTTALRERIYEAEQKRLHSTLHFGDKTANGVGVRPARGQAK